MKECPHCKKPLVCINVCKWCYEPIDPIKTSTLLWIVGGILIVGFLLGASL